MLPWRHSNNRTLRETINRLWNIAASSGWLKSLGLSTIVHTAGIGLLALVTISHPQTLEIGIVPADWFDAASDTTVEIDRPVETQLTQMTTPGGRAGETGVLAAGIETGRRPPAANDAMLTVTESGAVSPFDFEERLPSATHLAESALGIKLGKGFALGGGFGSGLGSGEGDGVGSRFFKMDTAGTKFVYILDGSASMTEPHSEARTRLDRVKIELV